MEITKDFIRDVLHLNGVGEKDVEVIHKWIYAVNHDLALFYDDERYDNDANKFRDAVIELSTKWAKKYSAEDVRTVAKYYELMKDWSIVENIQKISYDFNIFTCDAETIDGLRECVVEYVYNRINKVDKLVENNNQNDSFSTNLPSIAKGCLFDPTDNEIIVTYAYESNLLILERDTHTMYIPFDTKDLNIVNHFIERRKEHSNINTVIYQPFNQSDLSQTIYTACTYDTLKKKYNMSVEGNLANAIQKYYYLTPKFNRLNFIIKYKDNNGENPIFPVQ